MSRTVEKREKTVRVGGNGQVTEGSDDCLHCGSLGQ